MPIAGQCDQLSMTEAYDPTAMLARLNADIGFFAEIVEHDARGLKYAACTSEGAIGNFTVTRPYEMVNQLEAKAETSNWEDS